MNARNYIIITFNYLSMLVILDKPQGVIKFKFPNLIEK